MTKLVVERRKKGTPEESSLLGRAEISSGQRGFFPEAIIVRRV